MKFLRTLVFFQILLGLAASPALTQDEEPVLSIFQRGVQQFNEKKFAEAKESFLAAYQREPESATFAYNLGLAAAELNDMPRALGFLRKARTLDPISSEYQETWEYFLKKFRPPEIPRRLSTWDVFLDYLRPLPSFLIFLPLVGLLIFCGQLVTRRIRERKAGEDHSGSPLALLVSTIFLLLVSFVYAAKVYDLSLARGTLLAENTSLKSAPDEAASEITQFPAGIELVLKEKQGDWLQVQYPGSFTGWVKAETILITSLTSPKQSH